MEYISTPIISQELVSRVKTWMWSAFWVSLAYFVDILIQGLSGIGLPTITADWGGLPIAINTAIPVGLVLNQVSKYLHNRKQ